MRYIRFIIAIMTLCAAPAVAKDFLPINRGVYVVAGVSCVNPTYANIQGYYGDKLSAGHGSCNILSAQREKNAYRIKASCLQPDDGAKPSIWVSRWVVFDQRNIEIDGQKFSWCAKDGSKLFQ